MAAKRKFTPEQIKVILDKHALYLQGKEGGVKADLSGADLSKAYLWGADLYGADLSKTDLSGADLSKPDLSGVCLRGVKFSNYTVLPTGERFQTYLSEVVPALLTAGGKTIDEIMKAKAWNCKKDWKNCPMHVAFGANTISEVPLLLKHRVQQFIQLFDAGLIPAPVKNEKGEWEFKLNHKK